MEAAMERKTSPRQIYRKLLANAKGLNPKVTAASDALVDEALAMLENEEPTLKRWLSTDQSIDDLLGTHTVATHALLVEDNRRGYPLEQTMGRLDALNYRLICTIATQAAMRERPLARKVLGP